MAELANTFKKHQKTDACPDLFAKNKIIRESLLFVTSQAVSCRTVTQFSKLAYVS